MVDIDKTLDGTLDKAIAASAKLKKFPEFMQSYMLAGDFSLGKSKKIDLTAATASNTDPAIQNYIAQISGLDATQQSAILKMTDMGDAVKYVVNDLLELVNSGKQVSGALVDMKLKANGFSDAQAKEVIQNAKLIDSAGNYLVVNKATAQQNLETALSQAGVSEALKATNQTEKQLAATIISAVLGQQTQTATTWAQKFALDALTISLAIAKQAAISFGIGLLTWAASNAIDYLKNLKTHSEELVSAMNDSHEAAQQATKDVEEIQSKIDELNNSLKDAGVDKIEDIVDPAERERLQAVNDMLQAQLELKKQLAKDAADKANTDTSAVVNDKTEKSIVKKKTVYLDANGEPTDDPAKAVTVFDNIGEDISKTESLEEHTAALNELTDKRRELAAAGKEDTQEYKDNEAAITSETEKIKTLSAAVSENMNGYDADADNFAQYKDEYIAGTNAITAATKALANANDDVGISTTNYDILLEKMQRVKAYSKGNPYVGAVNTLKTSGLETGDDIRELSMVPANQTKEQANAIAVLQKAADDAHVTLDQFISALEAVGLVAVRNVGKVKSLSDAMSVLDNMQSAYQSCAEAVKEYNKTGYVSMDTLQSLCQLEPQYLRMLELKNNKLKINTKTAQALTQTNIELAKASLLADTLNKIKDTNTLAKAEALLGDVTAVIKDADTAIDAAVEKSAQQAKDSDGWAGYDKVKRAGDVYKQNYNTLSSLFDKLGKQSPDKIWGNNSEKSATSALDAWSTLTSAMKEYNKQGYITLNTLKSLTALNPKYTSCLVKSGNQLTINAKAFRALIQKELKIAAASDLTGKKTAQLTELMKYLDKNARNGEISFYKLVAAIEGYSAALELAKENTDAFKSAWDNGKIVKNKREKSRAGALDYEGVEAQSSGLLTLKEYSKYDPKLISKAFNKETGMIDLSGDVLKDAVVKSLEERAEAASSEGGAAAEAIAASYKKAADNIENDVISVQDFFDGLGATIEEVNTKIDEMQSAWNDLSDVTNEYNTYGGLSVDSIQKLLTMSPEYLQFLKLEGNQLVFDKEAMLAKTKADILAKAAELELKEETKDQAEVLRALAYSLDKGADSMDGMGKSAEKLKTLMSELNTVLNSFIGVFDDLNEKQSNDLKIQGDAWLDVIDKRIDALNDENDAQERSIELAKLQDEYERAKANKTVHVYGGRGQGFVWKADENAVREAGQNLSDKQREYKKQDEIDRLNKLKDKVQEANNLIGTSWDDYQKKLKYTAEFEAMTFEQMEGHYDGFKDSVLNNMQAIQGATNIKNVINDISNLISSLETLANILNLLNGGNGDGGGVFGFINQIKNMFTGEGGGFDLGGGFKKMFDGAVKVVSDGWNRIAGKNRAGSATLKKDTSATLDILGNTIEVNTGDIQRVSGGFFERLVGSAKDNLGSIGKFFTKAWASISEKTGLMFGDIGSFFTEGFSLLNSQTGIGLGGIVETIGNMFGPIAAGAQSIGSAISSGVVSFFPSIFTGLGTLVTSVGGAMAAMMQAIATALSAIPIAGWIAAAAAVAGAVALIATIASIASNVSNTHVDEPTPAFEAKKYAKGTRGVKKDQIANVDEKGEELIVRKPNEGRMTYLEKGDGVIPAKQTDNLMAIGEDPEGWLAKGLAEVTGSAAAGAGISAQGSNAKLSGAAAAAAAGVGSVFKDEYDEVLGDTNEFMSELSGIFKKSSNPIVGAIQSMLYIVTKTVYRMSTVGKINSSKTVTESTSNTKNAAQNQISSMTSNFESSWKSVAGELGLDTKDIEATSKKMSEKMNELVNNTFDALNENTGLSAEQVEDITNTMFDSLKKIYASGWNSLASTSGDMSEEIAKKLNASYKSSVDSTNKAMNEISKAFGHSWNKVGGGVKTLSTNVQKTMEQAWADTSKDTQKLMYDMRACFDNSWSMNEAGVTHLADMTEQTIGGAYDEITSDAANTFGNGGSLPAETDNAWANVEPGAKDVNTNLTWMMNQSYEAIKQGCADAVTDIKNNLATIGDSFEAVGKKVEETKQASANTNVNTTEAKKGISKGVTATVGATAGAAIGGAVLGPIGAVGGALIGGLFGSLFGHASGLKSAKFPHMANVDEQGSEMLVRKPASGRYTYLETGDGVVPADITSRLFEMGGNPDAWFQKQMSKYGSQPIVQGGSGDVTTSIGDIIITNPVGSSDALANEIKQKLPTKVAQMQSKR